MGGELYAELTPRVTNLDSKQQKLAAEVQKKNTALIGLNRALTQMKTRFLIPGTLALCGVASASLRKEPPLFDSIRVVLVFNNCLIA